MQLDDRDGCVTDLAFDRWFAYEHDEARAAQLAEHLRSCARCRVRGELLAREREAFLSKAPSLAANAERARTLRRADRGWLRAPRTWLAAAAAAGAAAAMLLAWAAGPRESAQRYAHAGDGERRKGGFNVGFYVKRGPIVQRGVSGDTVHPGDQLGFTYSSETPVYLALLGSDGRSASVYFPASDSAVRVPAGSDVALDFSLELDEQLGTERLFAVSCPAPYALAPLRRALLERGDLPAPAGCRVERIALHKQAAP
jgi:hypothetical protein